MKRDADTKEASGAEQMRRGAGTPRRATLLLDLTHSETVVYSMPKKCFMSATLSFVLLIFYLAKIIFI